jgi:hypothetical protein
MFAYFVGGALGSASSAAAYEVGGWAAVSMVGALFAAGTLAVWLTGRARAAAAM